MLAEEGKEFPDTRPARRAGIDSVRRVSHPNHRTGAIKRRGDIDDDA
jgi:hypothetical protein